MPGSFRNAGARITERCRRTCPNAGLPMTGQGAWPPSARMEVLSPIGLDKQVTHDGATWLDKELMRQGAAPDLREKTGLRAGNENGGDRAAASRSSSKREGRTLKTSARGRIRVPPATSSRGWKPARSTGVGRTLAAERGRRLDPSQIRQAALAENWVRRTQLPSGNAFAMIRTMVVGFSLVPVERRAGTRDVGQQIRGGVAILAVADRNVGWVLGR